MARVGPQSALDQLDEILGVDPGRRARTVNDFVFEAYLDHRADVIYLAGLPDVPEKTFVALAGQGRS